MPDRFFHKTRAGVPYIPMADGVRSAGSAGVAPADAGGSALPTAREPYRGLTKVVPSAVDAQPATRGLGFLVALGLALAAGAADGIVAVRRVPGGVLSASSEVLVFLHCTAVLVTAGLVVGGLQELLLAAARRRPALVSVGCFVADGPRRWFATDPRAALGVLLAAVYAAVAVGPVAPAAGWIIATLHTRSLMAPAIALAVAASLIVAGLVAGVVAWPLGALLERAAGGQPPILARLASPGAALSVVGAGLAAVIARLEPRAASALQPLHLLPAVLGAALVIADLAALAVAGAWLRRRGRSMRPRVVVIAVGLAFAGFAVSGLTLGGRHNVASSILMESELTAPVTRALQLAIDLDHDGYSALFGGGDCDDLDPSIHPGAVDLPGDGIDRDCSGAHARWLDESGDGHPAIVKGPLAGVTPSFVLLSVDTTRADHMGAYGYDRPTTPNLDRFALGAARFTRAYCTSPFTVRSFASIWTGRYPSSIAFGKDNKYPELLEENVTLASLLADAGYASAALSDVDFFHRRLGMLRGFTEWHEPVQGELKADVAPLVANMKRILRERAADPRPFFVWAHMIEPHDPYRRWTSPRDFGPTGRDRYDEEIARADEAVGTILEVVDEIAAKRPLIVAFFADHGEAFGEHGYSFHGSDLHEEQVRVPLLVRGPGIAPGERSALTSLVDLHATILDYAGLRAARPIDARSLVDVLQGPAGAPAPAGWRDHIYLDIVPQGGVTADEKAVLAPPWKLIVDVRHSLLELYDLDRDPRELRNLFDDEPARGAALREQLLSWSSTAALAHADEIAAARLAAEPARMDMPLHVRFDDVVEVLGCDLPARSVHPGQVLRLICYYRALGRTAVSYRLRVNFLADDCGPSPPGFSAQHFPVHGHYQTTEWIPGELIRDEVELHVGPDVRAARYTAHLRVEDATTHEPLPPDGGAQDQDDIVIGHVEVLP
jgi:choline-sulfatase